LATATATACLAPAPTKPPDVTGPEVFGAQHMYAVAVPVAREKSTPVRFKIKPLLNPAL